MEVAFLASIRGTKQYGEYYSKIISFLTKKKGYIVNHIFSVTDDTLLNWSQQKRDQFFQNFYKKVNKSNLVIAECSFPCINLGYEISNVIQQGKEVIILKSSETDLSLMKIDPIYSNKNVYIYEYDQTSLLSVLQEAL